MKNYLLLIFLIFIIGCGSERQSHYPPEGFVYVHKALPGVRYEIRYFSNENFLGRPVAGYQSPKAILTNEAAAALRKVQMDLENLGYGIKVFDAYRPQTAVNDFVAWATEVADTLRKADYYPEIDKKDLFRLGYIYERSGHSRGSTVDLTLYDLETGEDLDMGSNYDFFGLVSHHGTELVNAEQEANRNILRDAMVKHGFKPLPEEWWHYTLVNEPYPDTFFDFEVR